MPELIATARLQLHAGFDLYAAAAQVPYLARLGVSHVYLSPIARARPGSMHGYDVIDPTVVCPERGGDDGLRALSAALREHGMGAILDIVPNHMACDARNPWWHDVLRHGRASRYARYFDIDWASPASPGRVWLPWLTAPLHEVLARGELRVARNDDGGVTLIHHDWTLPLADASAAHPAMDAHAMHQLLERQHYRLAWWRSSADVVNYRRFFDIDGLVALDMTCDDAFDDVHALPLQWLADGVIDGLRVDHVDGLADPSAYLHRLRHAMDRACATRHEASRPTLHVEKILRRNERLPADWPVDGTTGYEMMDRIGAIQHDGHAARVLGLAWKRISGRTASFALEERLARHQWLRRGLRADFARCLRAWHACLEHLPVYGDLTDAAMERACADVLAELPVYRTYITGSAPSEVDARVLTQAFDAADRCGHPDDAAARHQLRASMMQDTRDIAPPDAQRIASMRRRFEQLAAPLAAKAVEDTAFYRYGAWLSRNEVGSDPSQFSLDVAAFHRDMSWRATHQPRALSATATHDHKRGEDVRARLAALSEEPERWIRSLASWLPRLRPHAGRVTLGDLAMLLQTLVGAWPLSLAADDAGNAVFEERVATWWTKALREARLHTHWTCPNDAYERDATELLRRLFHERPLADVRDDIWQQARALDVAGALNGLVAATLRHTLPGVPDLYQGTEYWDLSLVDPDNRAAVDYDARRRSIHSNDAPGECMAHFRHGAIKQWLIGRLLAARHAAPTVFAHGDYQPWTASGPAARHVLAFTRRHNGKLLLVAVPRHCARAMKDQTTPHVPTSFWRDTTLPLPAGRWRFRNALDDRGVTPGVSGHWPLHELLAAWPVAVLLAQSEES